MYKLLLLLTFIVEESLGKGSQVMISFSQINDGNTTNTEHCSFQKGTGKKKAVWERGVGKMR